LVWDGKKRIDNWLRTYGGAESTEYTRAVGELVLVAGVRRIRDPGCKFDEMMVLESPQGMNKSTALQILAGPDEWFTDSIALNAKNKEAIEHIRGKWIIEISDLAGYSPARIEEVKAFLSRKVCGG